MTDDLRFPVGKWVKPHGALPAAERAALIDVIAAMPERLASATRGLSAVAIDTPYRPGGWTVRQLVHHLADSHANAYIRTKLIATEDRPPLKAYQQAAWAELSDATTEPVDTSIALLTSLHRRWSGWLRTLDPALFGRTGQHSENGPMTMDELVSMYAWHSRHHVAHITELRRREGW
jgi:hypothetical protein